MQIKEIKSGNKPRIVESLSEFINWTVQLNNGQYLFRGFSNENYPIEPSAYRRLKNKTVAGLLKLIHDLISKARSRGHDWKNGKELTDLELLSEFQHDGAATCLIDFSRNALVALWFACQQSAGEKEQKHGKVMAVLSDDSSPFKTVAVDMIKEKIDYFFKPIDDRIDARYPLYIWEPKHQNNRVIAQNSVFLFGGTQIEAADECSIAHESKQEILDTLDRLFGFSEDSMYPDFDGFALLHAHDRPYFEPDARAYLRRGIEALQRGNLDDAITISRKSHGHDGTETSILAQAYYYRGVAYRQKHEYEAAINDFERAIDLNPSYFFAYYNRGVVYYKTHNYDLANADFDEAIELFPKHPEAYYCRAGVYERKRDYERAICDLNKTIELSPNHVNAYSTRGYVYAWMGNHEKAITDCNSAIELDPNSPFAYSCRGGVHEIAGDFGHAMADCNSAIELDPENFDAYAVRGVVFFRLRHYERAIEDYTKGINLEPRCDIVYFNRGEARLHLSQWDEAKNDMTTDAENGYDIVAAFRKNHGSVQEFQQKTGITLPEDIAEMLTPAEEN